MSQDRVLAAIMFTDIVGYTALMGKDEHCTLQDEFIIPCPKFGTNEISGLNDL